MPTPRTLALPLALATACSAPAPITIAFGPAGGDVAPAGAPHRAVRTVAPARRPVWARRMGGSEDQELYEVAVDGAGNIALLGTFSGVADLGAGVLHAPTGPGEQGMFLALLDAQGSTRWSRAFGRLGQQGTIHLAFDPQGAIVLAGAFSTPSIDFGLGPLPRLGEADVFVAKLDGSGRPLWGKRFGDHDYQTLGGVAVDRAGNVVVVGSFVDSALDFGLGALASAGGSDVFVAQLDPRGATRWSRSFGGSASDEGVAIGVDGEDNVVVAGTFGGSVDFGRRRLRAAGRSDVFVAKLDPDGSPLYGRRFGSGDTDAVWALAVAESGHVAVTGPVSDPIDFGVGPITGRGGSYLALLDPAGNARWARHSVDWAIEPPVFDGAGNLFVAGTVHGPGELFVAAFSRTGGALFRAPLGRGVEDVPAAAMDRREEAMVVAGTTSERAIDLGTGALVGEDRDVYVVKLSR